MDFEIGVKVVVSNKKKLYIRVICVAVLIKIYLILYRKS